MRSCRSRRSPLDEVAYGPDVMVLWQCGIGLSGGDQAAGLDEARIRVVLNGHKACDGFAVVGHGDLATRPDERQVAAQSITKFADPDAVGRFGASRCGAIHALILATFSERGRAGRLVPVAP